MLEPEANTPPPFRRFNSRTSVITVWQSSFRTARSPSVGPSSPAMRRRHWLLPLRCLCCCFAPALSGVPPLEEEEEEEEEEAPAAAAAPEEVMLPEKPEQEEPARRSRVAAALDRLVGLVRGLRGI